MSDHFLINEVVNQEIVVLQQLSQQFSLSRFIIGDKVFQDELEPLGDMHFE